MKTLYGILFITLLALLGSDVLAKKLVHSNIGDMANEEAIELGYKSYSFTDGGARSSCSTTGTTTTFCMDGSNFLEYGSAKPKMNIDGTWEVEFRFQVNKSAINSTGLVFEMNGVTSLNVTDFRQGYYCNLTDITTKWVVGISTFFAPNSNQLQVAGEPGVTWQRAACHGSILLKSRPKWAH